MAAMALCVGMGLTVATAPADAARARCGERSPRPPCWCSQDGRHRTSSPSRELGEPLGLWTAMPGAAGSAPAAVCLVLAVAASRGRRRPAARVLATAVAVLIAIGPGVAALLVALGPGRVGGESALSAGAHVHAQASFEILHPACGRAPAAVGSHYVVPVTVAPRETVPRARARRRHGAPLRVRFCRVPAPAAARRRRSVVSRRRPAGAGMSPPAPGRGLRARSRLGMLAASAGPALAHATLLELVAAGPTAAACSTA